MLICPICESVFPDGSPDRCPYDQSPLYVIGDDIAPTKALGPGDIVAEKYELLEEMQQRGGAGRTFKARQVRLERTVELRLLPANTITRPSDHARFRREVTTWGRIRDDHLVRLYDSGFAEGNAPYMALEFVGGGSLGEKIRRHGALDINFCLEIAKQILQALDVAHNANVLHRDITPDAIVIQQRPDGRIHSRLTGFGLAKHLGDEEDDPTAITMTGQVVGNPAYMAPETIMLGVLDPRTDLYALGVTLYEAVAGERPFPGQSLADMLAAHVRGQADPIDRYRNDVPEHFRTFIETLLAREPLDRFQTAGEGLQFFNSNEPLSHPRNRQTVNQPHLQQSNQALFYGVVLGLIIVALGLLSL